MSAGDYDVKFIDGTEEYLFEDLVHVSNTAVLNELYKSGSYNNQGDYIYMYLEGVNIDPEKIYPVVYDEETNTDLTELVNYQMRSEGAYVYKLKKSHRDTYWSKGASYQCKVKSDKMPMDELLIRNLKTGAEWEIDSLKGYNDSHENKIVADADSNAVKLQSYLGNDLASVAFAAEGAARVAVTGTGNASTVTVSTVWDDFT